MILRHSKSAIPALAVALLALVPTYATSAARAEVAAATRVVPPLPQRRPAMPAPSRPALAPLQSAPVQIAGARRSSCTHLGCAGHTLVGIGF